jgi:hypothetical protein
MSLKILLAEGLLRAHRASKREVADLLRLVDRDLADAAVLKISADRRFATAYNAALQLATIILHAGGYRAERIGHHRITFQALPDVMGEKAKSRGAYFDLCRSKRNITDYDRAGQISEKEAEEILKQARDFKHEVLHWLSKHHPDLLPEGEGR